MSVKYKTSLLVLCLFVGACNLYNEKEAVPYVTFMVNVGGNGYDLVRDVLEIDDAYVLAGALGPQCDIVDAFMAKIDKTTGATLNLKTFGNPNQGTEENFFSMIKTNSTYKAVGFFKKPLPPTEDALSCKRENDDGKLFLGTLDANFSNPKGFYFEEDSTRWDSGFDIGVTLDQQKTLVTGAWRARIAVMFIEADSVTKVISSENFYGDGLKLMFHSSGRIFVIGQTHNANIGWGIYNTYWAEVDLQNEQLINERMFAYANLGWRESRATAVAETADGQLMLSAYHSNQTADDQIFVLKTDLNGNELLYKPIPLGSNNSANDLIAVDDGFVMTGRSNTGSGNRKTDAMIAKIDHEGNIIWSVLHDLRQNDDWSDTIIQTRDGGFLIAGRTVNEEDNIQTILVIKTDAEGQIE